MSLDILGIGSEAISAFQLGAAVTSKNIASSADENYSRETVAFASGADGGLNVSIKRISDDFLSVHMNSAQSELNRSQSMASLSSSIDQFITGLNGSDKSGPYNILNKNMQGFFDSLSNLSTSDKTSAREAVITNAQELTHSINSISNYMHSQLDAADSKIKNSLEQVNQISNQIAHLNDEVSRQGGHLSPAMQDERDKLLHELSGYVSIHTKEVHGQTNVYLANGDQVVSGSSTTPLSFSPDKYGNRLEIKIGSSPLNNAAVLSGQLGGLVETRNNYMESTEAEIGRMAATISTMYNQQNKAGYTKSGAHGNNIFNPMSFQALSSKTNTGTGSVNITLDPADISHLKNNNYELTVTSDGKYQIEDQVSGKKTIFNSLPIHFNGLSLEGVGDLKAGDSFLINPMMQAASQMSVVGKPTDIAQSNTPDGVGSDNLNALAELANKHVFNDGDETLMQGLSSIYSHVGGYAQNAATQEDSAQITLRQAVNDKQSVSGVNVQEEYTNLIHFQQSYSAASKIISADEKLFDSLITAIGV